jgi:hypothetical protein
MEKEVTQKVIRIIKDVDKTVQEVQKGIGRVLAGVSGLKQMFEKPDSEQR